MDQPVPEPPPPAVPTPDAQPTPAAESPAAAAPAPALVPAPAPARPLGWVELLIGVGLIWGAELGVGFVVGVALVALGILRHGKPPATAELAMGPAALVITTLLTAGWTLAVVWFLACRRRRRRFGEGFGLDRVGPIVVSSAVAIGLVGAAAGALISDRYGSEDSMMARLAAAPGGLAAICILAIALPPVEEFYYRGFLFPILRRYAGAVAAVAIVTVWFGAAHAFQLWGDWVSLACVASMGLAWTLMRQLSDSLVPSLVSHWLYNATLVFMSLAFPGAGN